MLKVSEHLKCKHIGWQETTPYCTLTNKYCGEKCLSFVNKYKEWEKFKSDVMMYSPDSVARIRIYERYKEFAEYFENLYRGILLALTTYSMSNDVDTYALFSQALAL